MIQVTFDDLLKQYNEAKAVIAKKDELLAEQEAVIARLQRMLFGQKSEKIVPPPGPSPQMDLFGEQGEATSEEIREEVSEPRKQRRSAPRRPLPRDLPRQEIVVDAPAEEKVCACCGGEKKCIGEDVTEKVALVPARLYVKKYIRPRYACGRCKDGVTQAPLPAMALLRASADASLLAWIIVSKYADHIPLCRMERIMARTGIDMPRRKTCGWLMEVAGLLRPLVGRMMRRMREHSKVIGADETPVQMLSPKSNDRKTSRCYMWVYHGDDAAAYTVYDFQESRGREGPLGMLGDYSGWLQSDDYSVYTSISRQAKWKQAGCWAHARRKFVDAVNSGDTRATAAINIIRELYAVERDARELDDTARAELRQERSVPLLNALHAWMSERLDTLPRTPLGQAIGYTLDNWAKLSVYTDDGRLPIDNNAVERAIRPVAVGRKNWLFAGSPRGGEAAAIFFTLIESARRSGLNLWEYFTDLLTRLPDHPINRLEQLLPDHWHPAQS